MYAREGGSVRGRGSVREGGKECTRGREEVYAREGGNVREGGRKCTRGRGSERELYIISKFIFLHPRKKNNKNK